MRSQRPCLLPPGSPLPTPSLRSKSHCAVPSALSTDLTSALSLPCYPLDDSQAPAAWPAAAPYRPPDHLSNAPAQLAVDFSIPPCLLSALEMLLPKTLTSSPKAFLMMGSWSGWSVTKSGRSYMPETPRTASGGVADGGAQSGHQGLVDEGAAGGVAG